MEVLVLLVFQGCQVQRVTQVSPAHLAVLASLAPKERLVSPVLQALLATVGHLGLLEVLCRVLKEFKDHPDHLEEQVHLAQRVHVGPQDQAASEERRVSPELLASQASLDRKEILVFLGSRAPLVSLVLLV